MAKDLPLSNLVELSMLLGRADAAVTRRLDRTLSGYHGISRTDFTVLRHLYDARPQGLRRVDLAERVGLSSSGVTRLLMPLERIGLVTRAESAKDRRAAVATLTEAGEQLVVDASASAERAAEDIFRFFTWEDTQALGDLLSRLTTS